MVHPAAFGAYPLAACGHGAGSVAARLHDFAEEPCGGRHGDTRTPQGRRSARSAQKSRLDRGARYGKAQRVGSVARRDRDRGGKYG